MNNMVDHSLVCHRCGSDNVKVELRSTGTKSKSKYYRTGIKNSWFIPAGKKSRDSNRKYHSVAICKDCGYYWSVNQGMIQQDGGSLGSFIGFVIIILIVSALVRSCDGGSGNRNINTIENDNAKNKADNLIWAIEPTPIEYFDYYIDGEYLYLKDCNSQDKDIYIASEYELDDGRVLKVVALEGGRFFHSANSIIVSEGITSIDNAVFNGCGVKYVYLPSTLESFSGFNYFHDGEKLYYGGDEASWGKLYMKERKKLDFVEIICNANIEDLIGH